MHVGTEWLIDAQGCDAQALRDCSRFQELCQRIIGELDLRMVQAVWHTFPDPGGLTGMVLLTESHLTCHTYPEHGIATFNLHCCRERPRWTWEASLREQLGATTVHVVAIPRGGPA
jgi:S-adenosylmethionine decarboxylase